MPDRNAGPHTAMGPKPGGVDAQDSSIPGGAVVGEAGIGDAVDPTADDPAGESDLGHDDQAVAGAPDDTEGSPRTDDAAVDQVRRER